jgi:hypothetical protein
MFNQLASLLAGKKPILNNPIASYDKLYHYETF